LQLRWLGRWAYRVMILNPGIEEEAVAAGLPKDRLFWMPNPVDTDAFAPLPAPARCALRQQFGIPLDARVVLYVGRLAPEKELTSLLNAFAQTVIRIPDAMLVLVGEGPEAQHLAQLVQNGGLRDRVLFTGREPMERVISWLRLADVFALVSSVEGLSCSLLEAMAVGLPSVVSAIPANQQLVEDGVHGLQVPVRDEQALAAALSQLLLDDRLRAEMALTSRQLAISNYSVDTVMDRYEDLFRAALAASATGKHTAD
jgi:glycosyltransferase involved in cell wall biosynthesis